MTAEDLEAAAKDARRRADIAKHTPLALDELDSFGDDVNQKTCYAQIDLMKLAFELQSAYAAELTALWKIIRTLRAEALYWRQKYTDEVKSTG
jgi:hypothetical protein